MGKGAIGVERKTTEGKGKGMGLAPVSKIIKTPLNMILVHTTKMHDKNELHF